MGVVDILQMVAILTVQFEWGPNFGCVKESLQEDCSAYAVLHDCRLLFLARKGELEWGSH